MDNYKCFFIVLPRNVKTLNYRVSQNWKRKTQQNFFTKNIESDRGNETVRPLYILADENKVKHKAYNVGSAVKPEA